MGLEDLVVVAGLVEAGSVDQAQQKRYASTQVDVQMLGEAFDIRSYR